MIIRQAAKDDIGQVAEILVEDWQKAYSGIVDDDYLDSMTVEQRYQIEIQRFQKYIVAVEGDEVLGYAWNELSADDDADCEIIALYVRYAKRQGGIGKALFQSSVDIFKAAGKKKMVIWCLKDNSEARKFYEKMGGEVYKPGSHKWGNKDYDMISYIYQLDK